MFVKLGYSRGFCRPPVPAADRAEGTGSGPPPPEDAERSEPVGADVGAQALDDAARNRFLSWSAIWPMRCSRRRSARPARRAPPGSSAARCSCQTRALALRRWGSRGSSVMNSWTASLRSASAAWYLGDTPGRGHAARESGSASSSPSPPARVQRHSRATRGAADLVQLALVDVAASPPAASGVTSMPAASSFWRSFSGRKKSFRPARVLPTWMRPEFVIRNRST